MSDQELYEIASRKIPQTGFVVIRGHDEREAPYEFPRVVRPPRKNCGRWGILAYV